jgi:hypothetical protein
MQILHVTYIQHYQESEMILTNQQLLESFQALQQLSNEKFSAKLAWKIQTARVTLQPFMETLNRSLDEVRMKYAVRDESGNIVPGKDKEGNEVPGSLQIPNEKINDANQELRELLALEIEVSSNVQFSISDFPESFEISANTLSGLQGILAS